MGDPLTNRRWGYRTLFALLVLLLTLVAVLPVDLWPEALPGPDLVVCLAFAWVVRRPDYVPPLLIGGAVLLADMMTMRPPGLWAALTVIGVEALRRRTNFADDPPFLTEWFTFALILSVMTVTYWALLAVAMVPLPGPQLAAAQAVVTILAYPFAAVLTRRAFGIKRPRVDDPDVFGRTI